ncbi:MAG: AraC family transcriptional regulator [Urechidicola sp.]|nr:AraC family transcriptional regulator [Urechidicola sp.]
MKVLPFKIPKPENEALVYQEDDEVLFHNKLHQHEEIQISFILKGEGTLVIGDSISDFKMDDIIVIGSNIPHVFNSDIASKKSSFMMTLFFTRNSFGNNFFDLNEFHSLKAFFKKSTHGFKILSNKLTLKKHFLTLKKASKLKRFILLFEILQVINKSKTKQLSSFIYQKSLKDVEGKRMSAVFEYTMKNFAQPIYLKQIASVATMTTNAFCKYFKQRTNKTYFQLLNEIRIANACKLLVRNKDLSINEVALLSGFQNISNFNRKFKLVKKMTPSWFRKIN